MFRVDFKSFRPRFKVYIHGDAFAFDFSASSPSELQRLVDQADANKLVNSFAVVCNFDRKEVISNVRTEETVKP